MAKTAAAPRHTTEMMPLELFALRKAAALADKVRDLLKPGQSGSVDFELRIRGAVQVGMPQPREERQKPDLVELLGMILDCLPTGERPKLEKRLNTLFAQDLDGEWPRASAGMRQVALEAIERWTRKSKGEQRGPVNAVVTAEVVGRH